jgi:putative peptide zinc metalloprotease protein
MVSLRKRPGDLIEEGEPLALLDNVDLRVERAKAFAEWQTAAGQLQVIARQATRDSSQAGAAKAHEMLVRLKRDVLDKLDSRLGQLKVVSGRTGIVIEPPAKSPMKGVDESEQLPTWNGSPFQVENQDAFFAEADLLCYVGDPRKMEAVIVLDQHDIDLVKVSDEVELMMESARLHSVTGNISTISKAEMKESPASLSIQAGGNLDTKMDEMGRIRPISTSYQARVPLVEGHVPYRAGYRGQAKVHLPWRSLGWRLYRFVTKTFNFEF